MSGPPRRTRAAGEPQHLKGGPAERIRVDIYPGRRARRVTYKDENVRVTMTGESTEETMRFRIKAVPMQVEAHFLRRRAEAVECEGAEAEWENTEKGVVVRFDAGNGARLRLH
ncbi:MAG: hypothetical protein R6V05_00045 [Candidatus Brocadiia bacterium]